MGDFRRSLKTRGISRGVQASAAEFMARTVFLIIEKNKRGRMIVKQSKVLLSRSTKRKKRRSANTAAEQLLHPKGKDRHLLCPREREYEVLRKGSGGGYRPSTISRRLKRRQKRK